LYRTLGKVSIGIDGAEGQGRWGDREIGRWGG